MKLPDFDDDHCDERTFAPFVLEDARHSELEDVRLRFNDWDWVRDTYGSDTIDDYHFNGDSVEALVKAVRLDAGLEVEPDSIDYNSEGDTCYIHFQSLEEAVRTAHLAAAMIHSLDEIRKAIALAREHGYEV